MTKHLLHATLLMFVALSWALCMQAAEIDDVLALKAEAERYTNEDVVELYQSVRHTLLPDGRREMQITIVRLLRTYWACDHYGDPEIPYDSVRQELTVSVSRTFMPGGKIVDTTPNGFNRVTPDAVALAPDYVGLQEMVVTHLGLEPGAVTYFDYTLRDREPLGEIFSGAVLFGGRNPVLWQELVIEAPAGSRLLIKETNGVGGAQRSTANGMDRYFWRMGNLPAAWAPDAEPYAYRFRPRVSFSNALDWDAAVGRLVESIMADDVVTDGMRRVVDDDLAGDLSPESRALALQTYIRDVFNYIDHSYPLFKRTRRPAARVFESGYGHKLDLASLYAVLAREAGLSADVALVFPYTVDVPSLEPFAEAWVIVQTDGGERFLDVTKPAGTCLREEIGEAYFIRLQEGAPLSLVAMPWMNQPALSELFATWTLETNGSANGEGVWRFSGALNYASKMRGGNLEEFLSGLLSSFWQNIKIEDVRVRGLSRLESELAFHMSLPEPEDTSSGTRTFRFPDGEIVNAAFLPKDIDLAESERQVPLFLRAIGEWHSKVRLEYPDDWKIVHVPDEVSVENGWGSFVQEVRTEEGAVVVERWVQLDASTIPPETWGDFQRILHPGWNVNMQAIVFK